MVVTKLKTQSMHCVSCEAMIKDALMDLKGVYSAKANHKRGLIKVNYDDSIIEKENLKKTIEKAGYKIRE
ncbi:heavy-metal-associated domain-containing protein [Candidatus Woesearchaeota archaeon]|nr:heavy-metal-associated domain-containing protein [Candidatus Woesearchaeota archaeon]